MEPVSKRHGQGDTHLQHRSGDLTGRKGKFVIVDIFIPERPFDLVMKFRWNSSSRVTRSDRTQAGLPYLSWLPAGGHSALGPNLPIKDIGPHGH